MIEQPLKEPEANAPTGVSPSPDEPWALRSQDECCRRQGLLAEDHMRPLADFLKHVRAELGPAYDIPGFDPCDGGVRARALFVLETPGPKAIKTGFVSRNNPDHTAKNLCDLLAEAGLDRADTLLWNIVPWNVTEFGHLRPLHSRDLEEAFPYLDSLLALLAELRVVVLVGQKAQSAEARIRAVSTAAIVKTNLPSQQVFNVWPEKRAQTLERFREVASILRGEVGDSGA